MIVPLISSGGRVVDGSVDHAGTHRRKGINEKWTTH